MIQDGSQPSSVVSTSVSKRRLGMILGGLCVLGVCIAAKCLWPTGDASAETPRRGLLGVLSGPAEAAKAPARSGEAVAKSASTATPPAANTSAPATTTKPIPEIVATVNGRPVSRQELAEDCLRHHGKEVLEAMVNKLLITQECQRRGITVTRAEVDGEIERMAKRFSLPVDQWMKLLKTERNIKPEQYCSDIIWPTLALRKLAGERLKVTPEELVKAFESEYGAAVRARLISCSAREKAEKLRVQAAAHPEDFGNLAKTQSEDAPSACVKGVIQPIRKHGTYKEIEQVAFTMADGDVSNVLQAGGQFVILKREGLIPARSVTLEQIAPQLEEVIRDRKMRTLSTEIFDQLQKRSVVENILNDPVKSQRTPGVAAMINGTPITLRQLAEECITRHGQDVLEGTINHKLIEQACKKNNIVVSEKEIDAEVARAASLMVKPLADGSPDIKAFLELVSKKQGIPVDVYRKNAVWPSVALKKLVGDKVQVNEDDLKRGFEANYGPRVRCRAIVMDNLRRAQQVWKMARDKATLEHFGELASQYSIEGSSRALQGEVPPIRKFGGQPVLEQEAFALKPGEISGVVQLEDKYVILFCEGYTKPAEIDFSQVRNLIFEDIREKKQRLAMSEYFEHLEDAATVDNFLAGTSRSPAKAAKPAGGQNDLMTVRPTTERK